MIPNVIKNKFVKINKGTCSFISYSGQCTDSPLAVSKELYRQAPHIKQNWIVDEKYASKVPNYANKYLIGTKEAYKAINSSELIIDNVYGPFACQVYDNFKSRVKGLIYRLFSRKNGQRVYTTWHGNAFKKIGKDQVGNDIINFYCGNLTIISGAKFTQDVMRSVTFNKARMELLGTPRNDQLFKQSVDEAKLACRLPLDKKIVLYAPTFRNDGKDVLDKNVNRSGVDQLKMIDFDKLFSVLEKKFGGQFVFVCRFHYHVANIVDWSDLKSKYGDRIINGNECEDMSYYLRASDVLITDASSCMLDYSLQYKPCFLFFPDLQRYETVERGFYYPIEELPFKCSTDFVALTNDILSYDERDYFYNLKNMFDKMGFVDDGNATERVVKYILGERK